MSCPVDDVFVAWAAGRLGGGERDGFEAHAAGCAQCRGVMLALSGVRGTAIAAPREVAIMGMIGPYEVRGTYENGAVHGFSFDHGDVAIRVSRNVEPIECEQILREANALKPIRHHRLVRVLDAEPFETGLYVATEPVEGVGFASWLEYKPAKRKRIQALRDIARALGVMHVRKAVHRNVGIDSVMIRRKKVAALTGYGQPAADPTEHASPKADQRAWWLMVQQVMGPKFRKRAVRRGLSAEQNKRYPNMELAASALGRPVWLGVLYGLLIAFLILFLIGVVAALAEKRDKHASKEAGSNDCNIATTAEWRKARLLVTMRLAQSGADTERVLAAIDHRTLRTSMMQRTACGLGDAAAPKRAYLDEQWAKTRGAFVELASSDPETVRHAVDGLAMIPLPDTADEMTQYPKAFRTPNEQTIELIRKIHAIAGDRTPGQQIQALRALATEVDDAKDPTTKWTWHYTLATAFDAAEDVRDTLAELHEALQVAETEGDDDARARTLITLVRQSELDPALEATTEAAVETLHNPALLGELRLHEGVIRYRARDFAGALAKLQSARTEYEKIAIDVHEDQISIAQWFGSSLAAFGDLAGAQGEFDRAIDLATKRHGASSLVATQARASAGNNLFALGKLSQARAQLAAAAQRFEVLVPKDSIIASTWGATCEVDISLDNPTDA
ncbi:MAG TPA: protein kinase, partial [Kofleriaceae bacterium]